MSASTCRRGAVVAAPNGSPKPLGFSGLESYRAEGCAGAILCTQLSLATTPRAAYLSISAQFGSAFTRIDVEGLPDSIKTACTIVNQLGVRYFWIDALVSDLPTVRVDLLEDALSQKTVYHPRAWRDWHVEAQRMASVYKNALVTITTVDKVPLPDILKQPIVSESNEPKSYYAPKDDPQTRARDNRRYLCASRQSDYRDHRDLGTRGWAFQERHLSRRIVSITNNGLYWDCLCYSASHRMPIGIPRDTSPLSRNGDEMAFTRCLLNPSLSQPSQSNCRFVEIGCTELHCVTSYHGKRHGKR